MAISYPVDCDTPRKRLDWLLRIQDKLIRIHNGFSKWCHVGLTEIQWGQFPDKIKMVYPYKPKITVGEYRQFRANEFRPRLSKITRQFGEQKTALLSSQTGWDIDPSEV